MNTSFHARRPRRNRKRPVRMVISDLLKCDGLHPVRPIYISSWADTSEEDFAQATQQRSGTGRPRSEDVLYRQIHQTARSLGTVRHLRRIYTALRYAQTAAKIHELENELNRCNSIGVDVEELDSHGRGTGYYRRPHMDELDDIEADLVREQLQVTTAYREAHSLPATCSTTPNRAYGGLL